MLAVDVPLVPEAGWPPRTQRDAQIRADPKNSGSVRLLRGSVADRPLAQTGQVDYDHKHEHEAAERRLTFDGLPWRLLPTPLSTLFPASAASTVVHLLTRIGV